jgi:lysophospholipase L1-like esterase
VALSILGALAMSLSGALATTLRIMPLGDSNTQAPAGTPGGYRLEEYKILTDAGFIVDFVGSRTENPALELNGEVEHEGIPGISINGLATGLTQKQTLKTFQPEYIQLMIGTNDVNQTLPGVETPEGAADRLDALVNQITLESPNAILLVASIPPFYGRDYYWTAYGAPYNAAIPGIVSKYSAMGRNVQFVDVYAALSYADFEGGDGVHMLQSGYDKIGIAFANAIIAVPEPSVTKLLLVAGGGGLLIFLALRGWRRLRAKSANAS